MVELDAALNICLRNDTLCTVHVLTVQRLTALLVGHADDLQPAPNIGMSIGCAAGSDSLRAVSSAAAGDDV